MLGVDDGVEGVGGEGVVEGGGEVLDAELGDEMGGV